VILIKHDDQKVLMLIDVDFIVLLVVPCF